MSWKDKGNEKFKAGLYTEALKCYNKALDDDKENAVLYSNRSAAYLRLKDVGKALEDAATCVKLKPEWEKGFFRLRSALEHIDKEKCKAPQALGAYEEGLVRNPNNGELSGKVKSLRRELAAKSDGAGGKTTKASEQDKASKKAGSQRSGKVHGAFSDASFLNPSAWAAGLSPSKQREWLVDCYRMRVDDNMVWGGECGGLYGAEDKGTVLLDFLVFCKLAVTNGVVPSAWDWPAFLRVAAGHLCFAFEKADAKEKWGGENVFSVMCGGRSLWATGEMVYQSSVMGGGDCSAENALYEELGYDWDDLIQSPSAAAAFEGVGGLASWLQLQADMPNPAHLEV